jgi:hypothetical protein
VISGVNQVYREDVKLQMDAKMLGDEFNLLKPPKKVDFITASFYEVMSGPLQVTPTSFLLLTYFSALIKFLDVQWQGSVTTPLSLDAVGCSFAH